MDFYNFFPSLSKSQEVYFGRNAPLAQTLINYSQKFIDFFTNADPKNKTFYTELTKITNDFGIDIAKDVNADKCAVTVIADKEPNASALLMMCYGDTCWAEVKDGEKFICVDYDKIADLEDITITQDGYIFTNKKNKILFLTINYGIFKANLTSEQIAAILCHEIGHSFQHGIYGLYKNIADLSVASIVKNKSHEFGKLPDWIPKPIKKVLTFTLIQRLFIAFISYLWFPNLLTSGVFAKFGAWMEKQFWGDKVKDKTYLMKDKLQKWDDNDISTKNELINSPSSRVIAASIRYTSQQYTGKNRNDIIKDAKIDEKKQWKEFNKKESEETKELNNITSNYLFNFFKSVKMDINLLDNNILNILALNNYNANQYAKVSFYKKYEYFADIFSASYGFSADFFKSLQNLNKVADDDIDKEITYGINKIPFFKSIAKTQLALTINQMTSIDVHGNRQERSINLYTALCNELQNNQTLTSDQKRAIKEDIDLIKESDEEYYQETKHSGFWFNYYNKLIDYRIKNKKSETTIKEILDPIEDVCRESLQK